MSQNAQILPATAADLMGLAPVLAQQPLFAAYGWRSADLLTRWQRALANGDQIRVAHREAQPVGLCWFCPQGTFGSGAYLRLIAVVAGQQRGGVGRTLLEAFERGCDHPTGGWFLLTSDFNIDAQRFYVRHGYQHVGTLKDFAQVGIAEYIFWKPLPRR